MFPPINNEIGFPEEYVVKSFKNLDNYSFSLLHIKTSFNMLSRILIFYLVHR